jgi:hypothetical protein
MSTHSEQPQIVYAGEVYTVAQFLAMIRVR